MIKIEACFLLNILCITLKVEKRRFLLYFLLFFFLNGKRRFFKLLKHIVSHDIVADQKK